ncbi:Hypothetical protein, putative [Bodo saltans]|uniref:Uncharacterized protein n=1 Tax=Bodo saltans TaxID=75058 RepID=A0A0S4IVE8_BODSA|nr:Hypothetical protein, putative [Bodo saltans]|eukprot:CUF54514.1 Hypothetical protein, putative [Bodo saltans]
MRKTLSTSPRRGFSKPSEGQSQHPSESMEESLNPPSHTSFSPPSASAVKRRGVSFVMSPDEKARNNRNSANTPEAKDKWPTLLKDEARLLETTHRLLQDLDASTVDLHKKNDELTESLRVNQANMTSLQEQLHKLIEELDGSEATVATQEGELRALRQFKSNRDDIVSGLRDVSTTTDSRLIDTYEMLFDQSDNARRQLVRQVEDLERTNSQLWTVVQRHESGAALLNAGNLFDDDDDDTATVVPDSSSNNKNATVNGANTAAALSNNLGEGETDADDVHLLQTVNDIASVSAQVDSESDLKATERSTDSVVPNNNSSAIRLKLVPRASETAPTQSPHYMRSTIARSPIVDNRTSTPNRRPAGQSTPSPLRKASPNPLRPGIPSSSNHTAGGVFSLLDANALTLNKSLLAALGPFEAAPLLAKAAEAIQLLRNQLKDIEAAVRQHRDDFDVLILPIVQCLRPFPLLHLLWRRSHSKEKHRHQQQQQQLVEAMQRYERIRAVQWEDHCAVSKQMYDTYQHITEILLKSLKRLHRVGFLVETRPPMLRATYEMYTVLLLCIRSISGFAKLTNEGRMSRREALGNVDRIADEVATATEGAAWMLANLFTDDELAHVGASPHLLPPDVKRPTWRDVRLPNHYQQFLDALATADRSVSPGREAGGGPQQQGGHATGTTSQNGIGTPRSVHGIVGTPLSTPSMTTIGTHSAGGGGGASRTRFESPVHSQRSGAMGGGGSALPVRTTLRLATPPRRNNFTDPLESSTNSSLTLNTPTRLNQTTTTSGGNVVMSPRPRHFSRR